MTSPAPTTTPGPGPSVPPVTAAPPPTSASSPTPVPVPLAVPLVCRDAWRARPPSAAAPPHRIRQLTVHHSARPATDDTQGPLHLRDYQDLHMDERGWSDIAYHVAVDRAGVAYQLRDWDTVGDTGTSYDPAGHFLLLLDGNFDAHAVPDVQLRTAAHVLAWAAEHFAVGLDTITGHRDHAITACPGDALYARLGQLRDAAAAALAGAGVELVPRCGPEVAEAVRSLEAGEVPDLLT